MWPLLLTSISASLFLGFVLICIGQFGIQSCYSAYGPLWHKECPKVNIWSIVTFITAVLLVPPILELSKDNSWQAVAFFCPALLIFVAATPDYDVNKFTHIVHGAAAGISAVLSILFIIFFYPSLWLIPVAYLILATDCMLIVGVWSAMFWYEMTAYAMIYTLMICSLLPI